MDILGFSPFLTGLDFGVLFLFLSFLRGFFVVVFFLGKKGVGWGWGMGGKKARSRIVREQLENCKETGTPVGAGGTRPRAAFPSSAHRTFLHHPALCSRWVGAVTHRT